MNMNYYRITIILAALLISAGPEPPTLDHHVWMPWVFHQPDPCTPKRKPQPCNIEAVSAVLQSADLPDYAPDPARSGDALTPQLRGMGAASAHKAMFWVQDWSVSPLTVYNVVIVFWDVEHARGYMQHLADRCIELDGEPITMPTVGDETNACRQTGGMSDIFTANFRFGNVVSGTGADGTLGETMRFVMLSLARIEQACSE